MASQVVDILMQRGRDQAAADIARGQAWSGAVGAAAAIPGDIQAGKARQAQLDLQKQKQQLEIDKAQREKDAYDRALKGQQDAADLVKGLKKNDDGTIDTSDLATKIGSSPNISLEQSTQLTNVVDKINSGITSRAETLRKRKQEDLDHYADLADTIIGAHTDPKDPVSWDSVHTGIAATEAAGQTIDPAEKDRMARAEASGMSAGDFLKAVRSQGSKYKEEKPLVLHAGDVAVKPSTGQTIATGGAKPKTEVELALEAAGGDPVKAMDRLKPNPGTPEQQYLAAKQAGDEPRAAMILDAIKKTKEAAQAPVEDVGIQADTKTTATGRGYIDLSKYTGKDRAAALQQAHKAGVYAASKEEADALANIDTARQNMDLIEKSLPKLPSSPASRGPRLPIVGAIGPGALANRFAAYEQTDPDLAAWGAWRSAAIQAMRAMAGSKGLRINKAEIEASIENDIPEITDTQATAHEKLDRVRKMLGNQEIGIMGKPAETVDMVAPDGRKLTVPASEVDRLIGLGAKRR